MRRIKMTALTCVLVTCLAAQAHSDEATVVEEAQASFTPWSGYWWPHATGELLAPLAKYDALTGKHASKWEREKHPPGESVPQWHGYCHAWSAASLMEREPKSPHTASHNEGHVTLSVGDQKGLLTVCHSRDIANSYGDRFGDGSGSEDPQDLRPDVLWRLLNLYIKQQQTPLILDIEAGPQVWNYPVYSYKIEYSQTGSDGEHRASLTLWMADDCVLPDHVGVRVKVQKLLFSFRMRNDAVVMGSGRWIGPSVDDHPDFAWYPYVAVAENPEIDHALVKKLVSSPDQDEPLSETLVDESPADEPRPLFTSPSLANAGPMAPDGHRDSRPKPGRSDSHHEQVFALSPLELVSLVAGQSSDFGFDVTTDQFDGGHYEVGNPIQIRASSGKAGYLYLLHISPNGTLALLYPKPGQTNKIAPINPVDIPAENERYTIAAAKPFGTHRIKAVVTSRPLILSGLVPANMVSRQSNPNQRTPDWLQSAKIQSFRWHPTQQQQVQKLLSQYQQTQQIVAEQFGGFDAGDVLGQFARDEVAFYVGPARQATAIQQQSGTLPQQQQSIQRQGSDPQTPNQD